MSRVEFDAHGPVGASRRGWCSSATGAASGGARATRTCRPRGRGRRRRDARAATRTSRGCSRASTSSRSTGRRRRRRADGEARCAAKTRATAPSQTCCSWACPRSGWTFRTSRSSCSSDARVHQRVGPRLVVAAVDGGRAARPQRAVPQPRLDHVAAAGSRWASARRWRRASASAGWRRWPR